MYGERKRSDITMEAYTPQKQHIHGQTDSHTFLVYTLGLYQFSYLQMVLMLQLNIHKHNSCLLHSDHFL